MSAGTRLFPRDAAAAQLLPLVDEELRKRAVVRMANEKMGQTLQPTALVHEAWLRLAGAEEQKAWNSRGHFFEAAVMAMQQIRIDHARRKQRVKPGGEQAGEELHESRIAVSVPSQELLAVNDALAALGVTKPRTGRIALLDKLAQKPHRMIRRHPVFQRGRKEELLSVIGGDPFGHVDPIPRAGPASLPGSEGWHSCVCRTGA